MTSLLSLLILTVSSAEFRRDWRSYCLNCGGVDPETAPVRISSSDTAWYPAGTSKIAPSTGSAESSTTS